MNSSTYRIVPDTELAAGWFAATLNSATRRLFRFEQQPAYRIGDEAPVLADFLRGVMTPPTEAPSLADWDQRVRALCARGVSIERVRIVERPPTDYQRWLRWAGQWNTAAGERIDYLERPEVEGPLRLLQPFGRADWWLIDDERAVVLHFDEAGRRYRVDEVTRGADVQDAVFYARQMVRAARVLAEPNRQAA